MAAKWREFQYFKSTGGEQTQKRPGTKSANAGSASAQNSPAGGASAGKVAPIKIKLPTRASSRKKKAAEGSSVSSVFFMREVVVQTGTAFCRMTNWPIRIAIWNSSNCWRSMNTSMSKRRRRERKEEVSN